MSQGRRRVCSARSQRLELQLSTEAPGLGDRRPLQGPVLTATTAVHLPPARASPGCWRGAASTPSGAARKGLLCELSPLLPRGPRENLYPQSCSLSHTHTHPSMHTHVPTNTHARTHVQAHAHTHRSTGAHTLQSHSLKAGTLWPQISLAGVPCQCKPHPWPPLHGHRREATSHPHPEQAGRQGPPSHTPQSTAQHP